MAKLAHVGCSPLSEFVHFFLVQSVPHSDLMNSHSAFLEFYFSPLTLALSCLCKPISYGHLRNFLGLSLKHMDVSFIIYIKNNINNCVSTKLNRHTII